MNSCGKSAKIMLEFGRFTLTCTLAPHSGKDHYDGAFCTDWTDVE